MTGNTVVLKPAQRLAGHRVAVLRADGGGRPAAGRAQLPHRRRRRRSATRSCGTRRRASSRSPARRRSAIGINKLAAEVQPGPDLAQARGRRDGRQGRDHRRRRGRPRRGGRRAWRVSAFGFQGQKCSACSRAIVARTVYDAFVDEAPGRAWPAHDRSASPTSTASYMGPVVERARVRRDPDVHRDGQAARAASCSAAARVAGKDGYFIAAHRDRRREARARRSRRRRSSARCWR